MTALLHGRDLYRSFGQTPALQGASLALRAGEIVAVMGPSGSGKSTLLHCLAGIYAPDRGEVWFDGRRLDRFSDAERTRLRRTSFGFVFQFGQLVPELTVADNVAIPLLLSRVGRKDAYARAESWLDRVGLSGLGGRRTGELSGGQAQRVAVARALISQPSVLFADEPTGALDSTTGAKVMDLLVSAAQEQHTAVLLVTHDAGIAQYADRTATVQDGRVTEPTGLTAPSGASGPPSLTEPEGAR
ncbi:MAG TPA: ABC transporter ATP-binding protein [Streptosporangiaceae bacterium]|nr:ABC transporter ATP-binding protein [Streptosporangiaceae bacterium]